jgi:uncharacterized BrkB/YihY/UPF0761 family membrane protein
MSWGAHAPSRVAVGAPADRFLSPAAYYFLPNLKQRLAGVVPGAGLVTFLWVAAARLLSLYFSRFSRVNLIYGSLGRVIAALLFFYVINVLFIYGAEFNSLLRIALDGAGGPKQTVKHLESGRK